MKRFLRKILAVGLCLALVLCVGVLSPGFAQNTLLFSDDFSANTALTQRGWDSDTGAVESEALKLVSADGYKFITTGTGWSDYTVSATVTMVNGTATVNLAAAGLTARTQSKENGYEFAMTYRHKTGATGLRLYIRNGAGEVDSKTVDFDPFAPHTLKMEVKGNTIACYFDNSTEPVLQYTDTAATARLTGAAGLRNSGITALYDDISVQASASESSSVTETSSEISSATSSAPQDTDVLFHDDFTAGSTLTQRGWDSDDGEVQSNILALTAAQGYKQVATGTAWGNYTAAVETRLVQGTTGASLTTAGISVRTTGDDNGYEFTLTYRPANGKTGLRLYQRGGTQLDSASVTLDPFAFHILRVTVVGDTLYCYLDADLQPVFTYTGVTPATGTVALRNTGLTAEYNSLLVRAYTSEVSSAPNSSSAASSTVSSAVSSSTGSEDASSGADMPENEVLYSNTFGSDAPLSQQGFTADVGQVAGGVLTIPSAQGHAIVAAGQNWTDYAASAEVRLQAEDTDSNSVYAGLTVRSVSSATGYEFAMLYSPKNKKTQLRLYDRTAKTALVTIEREYDPALAHHLKVVVVGNQIECYFDYEPVPVIRYTDTKTTARLTGSAGLANKQYTGVYDRFFVVRADRADLAGQSQPPHAQNGTYFTDDFNGRNSLSQEGWSRENRTIVGQRLVLSVDERTMYLNRTAGFELLTDYTVQADVSIDATQILNGVSIGSATIVGRATGADGYEFGIFSNDSGSESYARLYDRTGGKILAINQDVAVVRGQVYRLKMVLLGQTIRCFVDDVLVIEVTDSGNAQGTAGLRVGGYTGYYDNFTLRQVTKEDLAVTEQPTLPNTGESFDFAVYGVLLCSGALLVLFFRRKKAM